MICPHHIEGDGSNIKITAEGANDMTVTAECTGLNISCLTITGSEYVGGPQKILYWEALIYSEDTTDNAGNYTAVFTVTENASGEVSLNFTITDIYGQTATASVTVTITA